MPIMRLQVELVQRRRKEMTFTFITYGILGLIAGACLGALAVVMFKGDEE
jgi:nitrate reductase NapE component